MTDLSHAISCYKLTAAGGQKRCRKRGFLAVKMLPHFAGRILVHTGQAGELLNPRAL